MSTITHFAFIKSMLLAASLLAGCAGTGNKAVDPLQAVAEEGPTLNQKPSPEAVDWAAQAQRDVEDFFAQREKGRQKTDEASIAADVESAAPGPPRISWNQPSRSTSGAPATPPSRRDEATAGAPAFVIPPVASNAPELEPVVDPASARGDLTVDPLQTDRLQQLMIELSTELRRRGSDSDAPLPYLLAIAGMALADPDRAVDPESLYDLSNEERELFGLFQDFFARTGRDLTDCQDARDAIADAVAGLRESLAGELRLPTAELCYSVTGFGIYKTFDRYAFLAHQGQQVIVYLEIDDFESELNKQGKWITETSQLLTIYGDDGLAVWGGRDWATAVDAAQKRRRDYFTVQTITLPNALSVGKYTLKIRVRDEKTGAEAERSIPFEMVADPHLAAKLPQ